VKLLLDTQSLIWFDQDDPRLSSRAKSLLEAPDNELWLSPVTYWEIAIKASLGKLTLTTPFDEFLTRIVVENRLVVLPILVEHCAALIGLAHHHRDPFDRLLIAQAITEKVAVVSSDEQFDAYPVIRLWN